MQLIVISSAERIVNEHAIVNELFKKGMKIFHLRKPLWDLNEMEEFIMAIDKDFHKRIVIHSHYNLCKIYNLKGIHFTGKTKAFAYEYSDWNVQKSISTHSIEEVCELKEKYDYIFLSPFFDSLSKEAYKSEFNMENLKLWLNDYDEKIVALGGICPKNLEKISEFNLYGVAVLGYLWNNQDLKNITLAFERLHTCLEKEQEVNLKH